MSQRVLLGLSRAPLRRPLSWVCQQCRHYAETTPPAPPLLLKLRNDLKGAMKAKDTARLNVLRGLLAEVTNSAKTQSPIQTDMQVLSLLRKRSAAAKAAGDEFKGAGRQDLVDKEKEQADMLDAYAGEVEVMSEDDLRSAVVECVEQIKSALGEGKKVPMGEVMKKLLAPGGALDGKPADKAQLSRLVKDAVAS